MHRSLMTVREPSRPTALPTSSLAGPFRGRSTRGLTHIAPGVALAVGHHGDAAQRAASLDAQGYRAILLLELVAHHGGGHQAAAQGRGGHGRVL